MLHPVEGALTAPVWMSVEAEMDATAAPDSARMVRLVAEARSRSQAARLLKTLVFAGAYLGGPGCGGQSRAVVEEGDAPGSGGTATDPAGMGGLAGSTAG